MSDILSGIDFAAPAIETKPVPVGGKHLAGYVKGSLSELASQRVDVMWLELGLIGRKQRDISQKRRELRVFEDDGTPYDPIKAEGRNVKVTDYESDMSLLRENAKLEEQTILTIKGIVQEYVPDMPDRDAQHVAANTDLFDKLMRYLGYAEENAGAEEAPKPAEE